MNKKLITLSLLAIALFPQNLFSQNKKNLENDTIKIRNFITPDKAEKTPLFKGKDPSKFREWLYINMRLPADCRTEGVASVEFVVDSTGAVRDVRIQRGITPSFNEALVNLVKSSPKWKPGMVNGTPVNVRFVMPFVVKFR